MKGVFRRLLEETRDARGTSVLAAVCVAWSCGGTTAGRSSSTRTEPDAGLGEGGAASGGTFGTGGTLPASWFACTDTAYCMIWGKGCCDKCKPASISDAIAVADDSIELLLDERCGPELAQCEAVDCSQEPPFVVPLCTDGKCTAVDIRQDELTSCSTAEQCRLRVGTSCCPSCAASPAMVVAVSTLVDFDAIICGAASGGCSECVAASVPPGYTTACVDNHCQAVPP